MDSGETEYSFSWLIDNYSYSVLYHLLSPEFTPQGLKGTSWVLHLCPSRLIDGTRAILLKRSAQDAGPENISLKLEITISKVDGSTFYSERCEHAFGKGVERGFRASLDMDELFVRKNTEFLPQDTLVVRCKMWKGEGIVRSVVKCCARTRIGIAKISYIHRVKNFSALERGEEKTLRIPSHSKAGCDCSSSLYITEYDGTDGVLVHIVPPLSHYEMSKRRVSLIDRSGNIVERGEVDWRFSDYSEKFKTLCQRLSRQFILNNRKRYLPNDELSLLCEFTFTTGPELSTIEETVHAIPILVYNQRNCNQLENNYPIAEERLSFLSSSSAYTKENCNKDSQTSPSTTNFVTLHQMTKDDLHKDKYNEAEKLCMGPSMQDDFKAFYNDKLLTDVVLKTSTESFPAHKNVLCARSAVFRAMLTNDMKEKITNCIRVDDLENETVQRLLLFLYSDRVEDLQWESALKLYYAGDKYEIKKLKVSCSSFLVKSITILTASELLLLADTHSDTNLKKLVEDFILEHDEEIFCSDEWAKLNEINPHLGMNTVRLKYKKKNGGK